MEGWRDAGKEAGEICSGKKRVAAGRKKDFDCKELNANSIDWK